MKQIDRLSAIVFGAFLFAAYAPNALLAQSVLERTPNLHNGWVGDGVQFNFNHRMRFLDIRDEQRLISSPTFLLGVPVREVVLLAVQYASSSDVVESNEWEVFARWAALDPGDLIPVGVAVTAAYNAAATSGDGELAVRLPIANLELLGSLRALSNAYETSDFRVGLGAGVVARVSDSVALAGDVISLVNRRSEEDIVWGGGLQLRVPRSPHTVSFQVTNASSATLEGSSRGSGDVMVGFEFTIPLTFLGGGS